MFSDFHAVSEQMKAASSALPQQDDEEARHHEQAVPSDRHGPTVPDPADQDEQRGDEGDSKTTSTPSATRPMDASSWSERLVESSS
jgi:hypothetical protein